MPFFPMICAKVCKQRSPSELFVIILTLVVISLVPIWYLGNPGFLLHADVLQEASQGPDLIAPTAHLEPPPDPELAVPTTALSPQKTNLEPPPDPDFAVPTTTSSPQKASEAPQGRDWIGSMARMEPPPDPDFAVPSAASSSQKEQCEKTMLVSNSSKSHGLVLPKHVQDELLRLTGSKRFTNSKDMEDQIYRNQTMDHEFFAAGAQRLKGVCEASSILHKHIEEAAHPGTNSSYGKNGPVPDVSMVVTINNGNFSAPLTSQEGMISRLMQSMRIFCGKLVKVNAAFVAEFVVVVEQPGDAEEPLFVPARCESGSDCSLHWLGNMCTLKEVSVPMKVWSKFQQMKGMRPEYLLKNAGIRRASAKWVAIISADVVLSDFLVSSIVKQVLRTEDNAWRYVYKAARMDFSVEFVQEMILRKEGNVTKAIEELDPVFRNPWFFFRRQLGKHRGKENDSSSQAYLRGIDLEEAAAWLDTDMFELKKTAPWPQIHARAINNLTVAFRPWFGSYFSNTTFDPTQDASRSPMNSFADVGACSGKEPDGEITGLCGPRLWDLDFERLGNSPPSSNDICDWEPMASNWTTPKLGNPPMLPEDPPNIKAAAACRLQHALHTWAAGDFVLGHMAFWAMSGGFMNLMGAWGIDAMLSCSVYGACFEEVGMAVECAVVHLAHERRKGFDHTTLEGLDPNYGAGLRCNKYCMNEMMGLNGNSKLMFSSRNNWGLHEFPLTVWTHRQGCSSDVVKFP